MKITSADFTEWTIQNVADFLLDHNASTVSCQGYVDGRLYNLEVRLFVAEREGGE